MWEWISLVTWVIQEIGLSRNTTLCVTPIPEEWFFQPPSSFSFFIFLNLYSLILLEHHCYYFHFPSKHIQTLNQIPYIQPSINLSLSLLFNKFHKKRKKNLWRSIFNPCANGFTSFWLSELRFKGFSRVLGLKFLGNILLISSLPFYHINMYIGVEGVTRDILMLLNKRNSNCSNTSHTFNYHDDNHNECPRHHFHSASLSLVSSIDWLNE